jgi:endo-1,4-beta-xylanase
MNIHFYNDRVVWKLQFLNKFFFLLPVALSLALLACPSSSDDSTAPTVTSVTVNPGSAIVSKGGTRTFTATVSGTNNPAQTVTWSVDTPHVTGTRMNGGTLTVAANETATTLTVRATSTQDTGKSGTATVSVTEPSVPTVTSVTVSPRNANVNKGGTQVFTATVSGTNSPAQTVTWSVDTPYVTGTRMNGGTLTVAANESAATLTVRATSTQDTSKSGTATVSVTSLEDSDMMALPPMKDRFATYFLIGNIAVTNDANAGGTAITNTRLTRHYNVLTAENDMKPDTYGTNANSLNFSRADRFVNAATASGFKIVGHTLLWHSQIPQWQRDMASASSSTALTAMKKFITDVVTHFKGKIHSWDVLNEIFPDSVSASANWKTSMRTTGDSQAPNPWFVAIGSDFVYEGFLAARLADPDAILYYNDYNLDSTGKATMVRNMVRDVNALYKQNYPSANRLLIEGIGMQSHHNINVSANAIKATLDLFRPLGVKISISELDVLSQSWSDYSSNTPLNDSGKQQAANLYGEYLKLFVANKDIIERVTFWGVYDEQSWRARGKPLLFEGVSTSTAKPAYYKVIEALE